MVSVRLFVRLSVCREDVGEDVGVVECGLKRTHHGATATRPAHVSARQNEDRIHLSLQRRPYFHTDVQLQFDFTFQFTRLQDVTVPYMVEATVNPRFNKVSSGGGETICAPAMAYRADVADPQPT